MKIPILHTLEKKLRHARRIGTFDPNNSTYSKSIKPELSPIRTEEIEKGFLQPRIAKEPLVSIIIPVFNQFEYTRKCLNSIARNTPLDIPYEIILIDDHSSDKTIEINKYYPDITVHRNETNRGFIKNINFAATIAKGKYLQLLNNDTIVAPEWLSSMLNVFERFESVGAVGSKLVYPNGALQEAGGFITSTGHFGNFGRNQNYFDPKYNYIREVDYVSGASLLISRDLWIQLNGFDEEYLPAYFEDTDLAMRIRQAGRRVMYQPASTIFHFESISYSKTENNSKTTQMEKNRHLFLSKWKSVIRKTHKTRHDGFRFYERNTDNNRTILYIDAEVPNDYSCGAKLSLNYCQLLREMGHSIKFLPMLNSETIKEDITRLGQLGIETLAEYDKTGNLIRYHKTHLPRFKAWLEANMNNIDHYLLARPSSYDHLQTIRQVRPNASFVYHPADLHFLRYERSQNFQKKNSGLKEHHRRRRMAQKKKRELDLLKEANKVLHVSTYEMEYMKVHFNCQNGTIIPCLFFDHKKMNKQTPIERKDLMFIGGKHSASVDGIKWFIEEIFPQILQAFPNTTLHIVGDCGGKTASHRNVVAHGRLPENKVINLYQTTIAILPLRFGAGVKGKALEAMYHGTPIVSTSIGLEGIPDIEQALEAHDDARSFANQIIQTINNPEPEEYRIQMCQNIIKTHFSKKVATEKVTSIFLPTPPNARQCLFCKNMVTEKQ